MPWKNIPCSDCAQEKQLIEANGAAVVTACEVLDEDQDKPEPQRKCRISWRMKPFAQSERG